jgi:hypothetical protein
MLWRTVVKITFRLSSVGVKYGDGLPMQQIQLLALRRAVHSVSLLYIVSA